MSSMSSPKVAFPTLSQNVPRVLLSMERNVLLLLPRSALMKGPGTIPRRRSVSPGHLPAPITQISSMESVSSRHVPSVLRALNSMMTSVLLLRSLSARATSL